ncbi:hypothetical protein [Schlesneria paludicola]|uniref:hypothetical protein n=1 Tax=Schlesneria paludicola TaxID=360056 RepID=UPI0009FFB79B|nr:hypothetical protein [Schlesneria paludicola]
MTGSSSCPDCGTILRIRDRSFVGRRVSCPECKTPLRIESFDEDAGFSIRKLKPEELKNVGRGRKPQGHPQPPQKSPQITVGARFARILSSPLTAACLLLIGMIAFFIVLRFKPKLRLFSPRTTPVRVIPESPSETITPMAPRDFDDPEPLASAGTDPVVSQFIDDSESLSALEPANTDGPLIWPPQQTTPEQTNPSVTPTPAPVVIDVVGKMAQKLVSYKQPKVSRRHLIEALSEYLGAPIRYDADELGTDQLEAHVSFELKNTTVGDVIRAVAQEASWQIEIETTGLRLRPKRPMLEP